jgi:S-layer protein
MTTAQNVQTLYLAYFGRPADGNGLDYWVSQIDGPNKQSLQSAANNFALSPEYTSNFTGLSSTQIVKALYLNLFGRQPELGGLKYWSNQLDFGQQTVSKIALSIALGAIDTATTKDATALSAKIQASAVFTTAINTGTADEFSGYDNATGHALGKTYLASVVDAATLAAATAPAALDATLLAVATNGNQVPGQTFALTSGIDSVVGTTGNDTISSPSTGVGLTGLDKIDGGAGTDTLSVTADAAIAIPVTAVVKNVEIANLTSSSTITGDVSGWTGLTKLTVAEVGGNAAGLTAATTTAVTVSDAAQGAGTITINGGSSVDVSSTGATNGAINVAGATGAVSVARTSTTNGAAGSISVTGGTTVNVAQTAANAVATTQTNGTVAVIGSAATTSVTVASSAIATASGTKAGVIANAVGVQDVNYASATDAGTIKSVTVSNFTTLTINDNALTSLSVTGGSSNIIIDNSGLTTATNKTLALTVNGQTGGTLDDADIYTTLNVTTAGANSTFANITTGGVTALTVAGTKGLTLTSTTGLALKTVTVSGAAGVTGDFSAGTVTAVDTSATTGKSTVTVDAAKATFTGGAGVDVVTLTNTVAGKAISLGAGDDTLVLTNSTLPTAAISGGAGTDTLSVSAAVAATQSLSSTFASIVTGFEHLTLSGSTNQSIDLAALGNFNYVTTAGGNGLGLHNLGTGGTLALTGAGTAYTVDHSVVPATNTDTLNLILSADASGAGTSFAATGITASNVVSFDITSTDTAATPAGAFNHSVTLLGNVATSITVHGNAGLALTAADTALTSVDASGITLGGFTFTSSALTAAATIKGSATGINVVDASAAVAKAVTYVGGTGADTFTVTNAKANIITLGDGTNIVAGAASGNNTVTGGANADTVTLGAGNNTVSLGNGVNIFTAGNGNNTYTGGTGVDTVTVGGGANTITTGTGNDIVTFTAAVVNVNSYSTITDAHSGETIAFATKGVETFSTAKVTLAGTAVFQDYANAVVQAGGNASVNGALGWFQFNGDTYLVESAHDGSGVNASFVNGVDNIVKLTGLVDLSLATGIAGHHLILG